MIRRIVVALAIVAGGFTAAPVQAAGTCGVSAGTPHIEYLDELGDFQLQANAGLNSCTKDGTLFTLDASLQSRVGGVWTEIEHGTATRSCGRTYRFACGTSVILETTLFCSDSDSPSTLTLRLVATGADKTVTSPMKKFTCRGYGGGDGGGGTPPPND